MATFSSPVFVDSDTFTVSGDHTDTEGGFDTGRKLECDCGVDGLKYGAVLSASYDGADTTVNLTAESDALTSNLTEVVTSPVRPGSNGNLSYHSGQHEPTGPDSIADVAYDPSTVTDWDSDTDPGDVDDGLDQLASRTTTLETDAFYWSLVMD